MDYFPSSVLLENEESVFYEKFQSPMNGVYLYIHHIKKSCKSLANYSSFNQLSVLLTQIKPRIIEKTKNTAKLQKQKNCFS